MVGVLEVILEDGHFLKNGRPRHFKRRRFFTQKPLFAQRSR